MGEAVLNWADIQQLFRLSVVGAALYTTLQEVWLHRFRRHARSHLALGIWSFLCASLLGARFVQHAAAGEPAIVVATAIQYSIAALAVPSLLYVARTARARSLGRWEWVAAVLSALVALVPIVEIPSGVAVVWRLDALGHRFGVALLEVTSLAAALWSIPLVALLGVVLERALIAGVLAESDARTSRRLLRAGFALLIAAGVNDILLMLFPLPTVTLMETALAFHVFTLAYTMALRAAAISKNLEDELASRLELLRERQEQLVAADRLASLGTLGASVAHELSSPLTYISANLQTVDARLRAVPAQDAWLGDARELVAGSLHGADAIQQVVEQLRLFARMDDGERQRVDVSQAMRRAMAMVTTPLRHSAEVSVKLARTPHVEARLAELTQLFLHLLTNAVDAVQGEGRGHIGVRTCEGEDGYACIEVEDDGPGIAPQHRAHVFEPFFTTKPMDRGQGLGLAICHGIVTGYGGTIEVESELGVGTRVSVRLPPYDEARVAGIAEEPRALPAQLIATGNQGPLADAPTLRREPAPARGAVALDAAERRSGSSDVDGAAPLAPEPEAHRPRSDSPSARPRGAAPVGLSPVSTVEDGSGSGGGTLAAPLRVLLVDDDPLVGRAIRRQLRPHEVTLAGGGAEALAATSEREFDVILCDLSMPAMGGVDVYEALRRDRPDLAARLAFVSGGAVSERDRSFLREHAVPCIDKPIDRGALASVLDRLGARSP